MADPRPRLVCRCLGVSSPRIEAAIRSGGAASVLDVIEAVGAGGACGTCRPEIEEILADARGEPFEATQRVQNRLVCEAETQARVAASLGGAARAYLASCGITIEAVEIEGLQVRIRYGGDPDPEAERFVSERLREYVCEDLQVKGMR